MPCAYHTRLGCILNIKPQSSTGVARIVKWHCKAQEAGLKDGKDFKIGRDLSRGAQGRGDRAIFFHRLGDEQQIGGPDTDALVSGSELRR